MYLFRTCERRCTRAVHPGDGKELMCRTYYVFQSATAPDLRGMAGDWDGTALPVPDRPGTLGRRVAPNEPWTLNIDRLVVEYGLAENGFHLWGAIPRHASAKPVIESDWVEGTAVFDLRSIGSAPSNGF
jgi:hypothetical protein